MPALALVEKLLPLMKLSNRLMDSCELHILLAIIAMQTNQQERMITHIREALLLSYKNYCSNLGYVDSKLNEYIDKIMPMVLKVAEHYPRYLKAQLPEMQSLTPTELTVLRLLADGQSNSEIADYLSVSLSGVKFHVANIYEKLQVNRRTEAVRMAKELGIV